jgi:(hydroxyamino)benzene mutase
MIQAQSDWLLWHGVFVFFLGFLSGLVIPFAANPRMGLSAHVGAAIAGCFLVITGLLWPHLRLSQIQLAWTYGLLLFSTYSIFGVTLLAALWGTRSLTPVHGGSGGTGWQEALVRSGFISGVITSLAACWLLLYGLWP